MTQGENKNPCVGTENIMHIAQELAVAKNVIKQLEKELVLYKDAKESLDELLEGLRENHPDILIGILHQHRAIHTYWRGLQEHNKEAGKKYYVIEFPKPFFMTVGG